MVYLVESIYEGDQNVSQLGGFTTLEEAQACVARLEADSWQNLQINMIPVHERLTDWEWDR